MLRTLVWLWPEWHPEHLSSVRKVLLREHNYWKEKGHSIRHNDTLTKNLPFWRKWPLEVHEFFHRDCRGFIRVRAKCIINSNWMNSFFPHIQPFPFNTHPWLRSIIVTRSLTLLWMYNDLESLLFCPLLWPRGLASHAEGTADRDIVKSQHGQVRPDRTYDLSTCKGNSTQRLLKERRPVALTLMQAAGHRRPGTKFGSDTFRGTAPLGRPRRAILTS